VHRPFLARELLETRIALKSSFDKQTWNLTLDQSVVERLPSFSIEGRTSTMAKNTQQRANVLQGTLDMLILRTLVYGSAHGHEIGKHIQRTTNDFLQMQHGSLYPALHRLEEKGWIVSKWETAPDRNREFKYYRLTEKGRKQLVVEESQWKQMAEAVARVMWPAAEEN
jgi:PadR family transcriptional regulator, regulatory protein PadR